MKINEYEPCEFCGKFNFASAKTEVTRYGANILMAVGATQFPEKDQFNFCPVCGRPLKKRVSEVDSGT